MKITGLKTFIVDSSDGRGGPQWVFVKVLTDQDGLWGLGEGSVTSKATTIAAAIMEHERFLQGRDPLNIEWLWQQMYRVPRWRGGPVLNSALSAIEIALWDIKGVGPLKEVGGMFSLQLTPYTEVTGLGVRERPENAQLIMAVGDKELHFPWPGSLDAMLADETFRWIVGQWRMAHTAH